MGLWETIKDIATIAQKSGNIELHRHIIALQNEVQKLTEENRQLKEQVEQLKKKLRFTGISKWLVLAQEGGSAI